MLQCFDISVFSTKKALNATVLLGCLNLLDLNELFDQKIWFSVAENKVATNLFKPYPKLVLVHPPEQETCLLCFYFVHLFLLQGKYSISKQPVFSEVRNRTYITERFRSGNISYDCYGFEKIYLNQTETIKYVSSIGIKTLVKFSKFLEGVFVFCN